MLAEMTMTEPKTDGRLACCDSGVWVSGRLVRIAHLDLDKYEAVREPEAVIAELRKMRQRIDIFTFIQVMANRDETFSYPMEMDNLAILPVSTFERWWNEQIRSYPRNRARQAEKRGVVIREAEFDDALAEGIWQVYNETKVRQGRRNRHYGKDLETVRRESATYLDRSLFIAAHLEGKVIGFVKMVFDRDGVQASLMNIAAMVCHRDKATTNALLAHAVRACADRGIPYLMYQNYEYGDRGPDSMTKFKEINGFERVNLPRYYVPLTPLGRAALKFGLHHGLSHLLPKSVRTKARMWRAAWYTRRMGTEAGLS